MYWSLSSEEDAAALRNLDGDGGRNRISSDEASSLLLTLVDFAPEGSR
jgi:hypothetical protein